MTIDLLPQDDGFSASDARVSRIFCLLAITYQTSLILQSHCGAEYGEDLVTIFNLMLHGH